MCCCRNLSIPPPSIFVMKRIIQIFDVLAFRLNAFSIGNLKPGHRQGDFLYKCHLMINTFSLFEHRKLYPAIKFLVSYQNITKLAVLRKLSWKTSRGDLEITTMYRACSLSVVLPPKLCSATHHAV